MGSMKENTGDVGDSNREAFQRKVMAWCMWWKLSSLFFRY